MQIALQPTQRPDGTLPYPYFIDEKGKVGRQDFWKGDPATLIGFVRSLQSQDMALSVPNFIEEPKKAIGLFPVFADKNDKWTTYGDAIESANPVTGGGRKS
jgi:hypothetical protein